MLLSLANLRCKQHGEISYKTTVNRYPNETPLEARKCSAAQGPHSEVMPRDFWRLVSKSCDECKGSFASGCEAKRWSHWTCSSLGTIFQPIGINSVPDVKCFCNNKNVLRAQSMVRHFVRHPVHTSARVSAYTRISSVLPKFQISPIIKFHIHFMNNHYTVSPT